MTENLTKCTLRNRSTYGYYLVRNSLAWSWSLAMSLRLSRLSGTCTQPPSGQGLHAGCPLCCPLPIPLCRELDTRTVKQDMYFPCCVSFYLRCAPFPFALKEPSSWVLLARTGHESIMKCGHWYRIGTYQQLAWTSQGLHTESELSLMGSWGLDKGANLPGSHLGSPGALQPHSPTLPPLPDQTTSDGLLDGATRLKNSVTSPQIRAQLNK